MAYKAPKGTYDVLPDESYRWQYIEGLIRGIVAKYGLQEIRTPMFEHTELFLRSVGDTTDVVQKEMYSFTDKGGRSITLKPEGTAGAVRMFVERGLFSETQPTKLYYLNCPVFRYERPQAGRFRQHHQFGVEVIGAPKATADAEVIGIAVELYRTLGAKNLTVKLNSIGCEKCRDAYQHALKDFLELHYDELCETCKSRFETNPLRILDCKVDTCHALVKDAPHTMDYICDECKSHMDELLRCLDDMGIAYELDPMLVRGLDYYTKTVFEIVSGQAGAQGTLCGGGRYDKLVKEIGGPDLPAVGFGMGMERLLLLLDQLGITIEPPTRYDVMLIPMGEAAARRAFILTCKLRELGVKADTDHVGRSVKAQMKYADKVGAERVIVIGDTELETGLGQLKSLRGCEPVSVKLDAANIASATAVQE
ncbi:MAG TPA: histidine--tRNA ligase [Eubacteriales bacterium]|mgnify:CR=1 FL=1|nr:histidine--tRNA ligase [Clostridia bacterium]HRV72886.1 histidine--tRNA ligase [Eubacteriales bacterium]